MSVTHPELVALAWAVRILGAIAVGLLILAAAYALLRGYLRIVDRWRTHIAVGWLWLSVARKDRAKLWAAAEKWGAWNLGDEREREINAALMLQRTRYQDRESYLRDRYEITDDDLSALDAAGDPIPLVWSGNIDPDLRARMAVERDGSGI